MLKWGYRFVSDGLKLFSTNQSLRWNHYKSLGLTPSATTAEVKAAYYKLSKIYHPDRNNGSEASVEKFRDIVAAYEVLSKADSRKQYDREMRKFDSRNNDFGSKKKPSKRMKKNANSPKAKSYFKNDINSKFKEKRGVGGRKGMSTQEQDDFETFITRAIPILVKYEQDAVGRGESLIGSRCPDCLANPHFETFQAPFYIEGS